MRHRALIVAATFAALALIRAPVASAALPGDIDPHFGTNGFTYTEVSLPPGGSITALRIQPDGKIVAAGGSLTNDVSGWDFTVARYLPNGSIDTGFGSGGIVRLAIGQTIDTVRALAIRPDGKIVIGGYTDWSHPVPRFAIARLNPNGTPDTTFGNGAVVYDVGITYLCGLDHATCQGEAMALQPDGKVLLAGHRDYVAAVIRVDEDGTFDSQFGETGGVLTSLPQTAIFIEAMALLPDGRFVLGGRAKDNVVLIRYLSTGDLDGTFGIGGIAIHDLGTDFDTAKALVALPDGKLALAGNIHNGTFVARVTSSGALDPSFGTSGVLSLPSRFGEVIDLALDASGNLLVAGNTPMVVARILPEGTLDTTFGFYSGVSSTSYGRTTVVGAMAVQGDGKIVLGGATNRWGPFQFLVARLLGDVATLDPAADQDLDGIPNGVEGAEGTDPAVRDNDIFTSPRLFSMQQYRDFLGREGDAGGVDFWTGRINAGSSTRGQVIENFFNSAEFQGTVAPVARLYFAYFLRLPDYAGLTFWMNYYRAGNSLAAISNAFAQSPEFAATYGELDNGQFVNLVYNNVLGRAPDAAGFAFWKGQLDANTMTRGQVMLGFSESPEYQSYAFNVVYVTMIYVGMLRRAPDEGGFNFWVGYLNAGNSGLALINGFLAAPEYRTRFLP